MIFVVEGPDCAGKTVFSKSIAGARYHHEGPPPKGDGSLLKYYTGFVERAAKLPGVTVFDRLALGEIVYGTVLRGEARLSPEEYLEFRDRTKKLGAVHVLCLPPRHTCFKLWQARMLAKRELITDYATFLRSWEMFAAFAGLVDIVVDWTQGGAK